MIIRVLSVASLLVALVMATAAEAAEPRVRYSREVRPLLSNKCFACHGPDEQKREANLRLDQREAAINAGEEVKAIVPGQPDASGIIARVCSTDDSVRMPPVDAGARLTDAEVELLRRWIAEGAQYEGHWAFLPLSSAEPPILPDRAGAENLVRNGIDQFVQQELARQGLLPSPPADKSTLIRRVYLDLIGLLPSPAETAAFLADDRDEAYAELVERLLNNPHYGERWGRHWLDQARYADSHGYTIDGERVMWPYRDWVIRALNNDLPFDQFTIEQLAGDLLPEPTKQQRIATGFHRNTLINQEGGTDPEQFRIEAVIDRVNTTGAVWLGLTIGCAQCHSHKFDPISQREYYQLFAFFNHGADVNNVGPTEEVHEGELFLNDPDSPLLQELAQAVAETARLTANRAQRQTAWEESLLAKAALQSLPTELVWTVVEPARVAAEEARLSVLEDQSVLATQGVLREIYVVESKALPADGVIGALRLRVIPHESLPKTGPGLAGNGNFVLTAVEAFLDDEPLPLVSASATHAQPGYAVSALIDDNPGTGWAINVGPGSSARMNAEHTAWLALGRAVPTQGKRLRIVLKHELNNLYNLGRFQFSWSRDVPEGIADATLLAALRTPAKDRHPDQQQAIEAAFSAVDVEYKAARAAVDVLRKQIGLGPAVKTMVVRELPQRRETFVLTRGDFLRPDRAGGAVEPDVPSVLPALESPDGGARPRTRLELARWLVAPHHPLTPRVFVNRVWLRYFGRGLVETENDFGSQGSLPTHPDLLDWLARQFIARRWSQKELHRLIVLSHTYRQASRARPDAAAVDPLNVLLARQNRLRLDAEIIRDVALSAAGRLVERIGGPSVHPPQPDGVYAFTQNRKNWQTDDGDNRFRRAIYTMFYRSAPYPTLTTFDAPDFQSVCTRRSRSNTPLQALTLANDQALVELAEGLAARVIAETPSAAAAAIAADASTADETHIRLLYQIAYSRLPTERELAVVRKFLDGQHGPQADTRWLALARAIINTDEFITRE